MSILGENLKYLTTKFSISYRELARRAGLPVATIPKIINGQIANPRNSTMDKIANVIGVDAWKLRTEYLCEVVRAQSDSPEANARLPSRTKQRADTGQMVYDTFARLSRVESAHFVEPDILLEHEVLQQTWRTAKETATGAGGAPPLLMSEMPTDDLAPIVPRGATLYLVVEENPEHPTLETDAPAIGIATMANGSDILVFGTPSVSLGETTIKTASGLRTPVKAVVAYVVGWTVFNARFSCAAF